MGPPLVQKGCKIFAAGIRGVPCTVVMPDDAPAIKVEAVRGYGAEIVFCPSQSWGPSGQFNLWMQQARAIDNGVWMAAAHLPMSEISQRSYVLDPYGYILAASRYWCDSVCTAEIDLDASPIWFARSDTPGRAGQKGYLAGYYPKTVPEKRTDFRSVLMAVRRPELYQSIPEKTLAHRMYSEEVQKRMSEPRLLKGE